jgi:hypothetical protein
MKVYRGACLGAFISSAFLTLFRLFFERVVEPSKTKQGTYLGPFYAQKSFFWIVTYGTWDVLILILPVRNYQRQGLQFNRKRNNKKKHFLAEKSRMVIHTVNKICECIC